MRDNPNWWALKIIDGYGPHTSSCAAMQIYAQHKILLLKEEGDSSQAPSPPRVRCACRLPFPALSNPPPPTHAPPPPARRPRPRTLLPSSGLGWGCESIPRPHPSPFLGECTIILPHSPPSHSLRPGSVTSLSGRPHRTLPPLP